MKGLLLRAGCGQSQITLAEVHGVENLHFDVRRRIDTRKDGNDLEGDEAEGLAAEVGAGRPRVKVALTSGFVASQNRCIDFVKPICARERKVVSVIISLP